MITAAIATGCASPQDGDPAATEPEATAAEAGAAEAAAAGGTAARPPTGQPATGQPATELATETPGTGTPTGGPAPQPTPEPPPPPIPTTAREAALVDYFGALATRDPADASAAVDAAAPGSPAALFARLQVALARADQAAGRAAPLALQLEDDGVALCPVPDGAGACTRLTGISLLDGRVSGFDAGAGPVGGRIAAVPDAPVPADDPRIAVEVLGAYQTAAGPLLVAVEVGNGTQEVQRVFAADQRYVTADGQEVVAEAFGSVADADIAVGDRGLAVLRFAEAPLGGAVVLTGRGADSFARWALQVPLPPAAG